MSERQFFDDHNLIHVYTRAQAIADGVLHDVTATAKECGFLIPVAITDTIWSRWVEASPVQKEYGQSTDARLRDLLVVLHLRIRQLPKDATPRMKLCATDKAFYEVPGLYDKNSRKAYVNTRGEIKIKNALVDFGNLKLEPDKTEFSVSVEGNSIILTIITADGKETDNSSESCPMQTEGEA